MEEIVQSCANKACFTVSGAPGRAVLTTEPSAFRPPSRRPLCPYGPLTARRESLLQTLAVIGREFSSSLLRKVVTQPEDDLHRFLSRFQAGEFVYEQPAFPEVEYIFKHALTQEVAYNSLLIERRKVLHERTAQAIEEVYRHRLDDHYSELAYHYSRSGNTQKAIDYLQLGWAAGGAAVGERGGNHVT